MGQSDGWCAENPAPVAAPAAQIAVHRLPVMSIDKESTGLPEVNTHKRTTKVNLSIVIGVAIFFAAMAGVVWWLSTTRG